MGIADIIILSVVAGFGFYGFSAGFVRTLTGLVGALFAMVVALHGYLGVSYFILPERLADSFAVQIFVFLLILVVLIKVVDMLVDMVQKFFNIISIIPLTKTLNRIFGFALGLIEGILLVGSLIFVISGAVNAPQWLVVGLESSIIAKWVVLVVSGVGFMFPDVVDRARDVFGVLARV